MWAHPEVQLNSKEQSLLDVPSYARGISQVNKQNFTEAISQFKACVLDNPNHFYAWNNLGALHYQFDRISESEICFLKAHNINLNYEDVLVNLITLYLETKNYTQGVIFWYRLLFCNPESSELMAIERELKSLKPKLEFAKMPLVTIVMATYNRRNLLPLSIGSVLKQTYENFELVLVNDGGDDVSDLVNSMKDPRIKYFNLTDNFGTGHSFNKALYESKGEYITYLGDDDIFYPHHLEVLVKELNENPPCEVVYSDFNVTKCKKTDGGYRDVVSRKVEYPYDFDPVTIVAVTNYIIHMSYMHRRSVFKKAGFYDESMKCLIDWDFFRRLAFYCDFKHVPGATGEWMNPVNDKGERVSSLLDKDPTAWREQQLHLLKKRPARPWKTLRHINVVFHHAVFDNNLIEVLNYFLIRSGYPMNLFLFIDQYDEVGYEKVQNIPHENIKVIYLPVSLPSEEVFRRSKNSVLDEDGHVLFMDDLSGVDAEFGELLLKWLKKLPKKKTEFRVHSILEEVN